MPGTKSQKWSVNSNRRVNVVNGRFGTVVTKEKTKHINFGNVYYVSAPIPEEEFGDMVGLWRSSQGDISSTHTSVDDEDYACYRGDNETLEGDADDVWIPRSGSDSMQTRVNPFMNQFSRETVLQNTWHKKKRARPLPDVPRPEIPDRQEIPDVPGWYDLPNEPDMDSVVSDDLTRSEHNGSVTNSYSSHEERTLVQIMDRDQTRVKLAYMGEHGSHLMSSSGETRRLTSPGYRKDQQTENADILQRGEPADNTIGTPSAPPVPVRGNLIMKLKMPTIEWSATKEEEYEVPGSESCASPTRPGTKHIDKPTIDESLEFNNDDICYIDDELPPPIPPRIPIPKKIDKQRTSQLRAIIEQIASRHEDIYIEDLTEEDDSYDDVGVDKCVICETEMAGNQLMSIGHEGLHRLREKEAILKKRNEIDVATINVSRQVNAQLKQSLNNKRQLDTLQKEEVELESAIGNVGKQLQYDEYYAKYQPNPNVKPSIVRIQKETIDENQIYINPGTSGDSYRKISTKLGQSWSFISAFPNVRKNRFSSKMYAADSGIENE